MKFITLQRRLRLTKAGVGWLIACFCCFLLATNYNNNVIFMLACLLCSMLLLSASLTYKNIGGVQALQWRVSPTFVGQYANYQLHLQEHGNTEHYELCCHNQVLAVINKQQNSYLEIPLITTKRGYFSPDNLLLTSTWPLGLWRVSSALPALPKCLVYPELIGTQALPIENSFSLDQLALDEISGINEYQEGDNTRHIDWKASARSEKLLVKTIDGNEQQKTLWLTDDDVTAIDKELVLAQLAQWAVKCENAGIQYGLKVGESQCLPNSGEEHRRNSLTMLALC